MEIVQSKPIVNNTYSVRISCSPNRGAVSFNTSYDSYSYSDTAPFAIEHHWARELLTFTGSIVGSPGLKIVDWEWDLGEGTRKSGQTVNHVYLVAMPVVVHLRVRADNGFVGSASLNLMLKEGEPNILLNPYGLETSISPWVQGGDLEMQPDVEIDQFRSNENMVAGYPVGYPKGFKFEQDDASGNRATQAVELANGNRYRFSGWFFPAAISATTRIELSNPSLAVVAANQTTTVGSWVYLSFEYNVNTTGNHVVRVRSDLGFGGGTVDFTALKLELISIWL